MKYNKTDTKFSNLVDFMNGIYDETLDIYGPKRIIICVSTDSVFKMNTFNFDQRTDLVATLQKVMDVIVSHPEIFEDDEIASNVIPFRPRNV